MEKCNISAGATVLVYPIFLYVCKCKTLNDITVSHQSFPFPASILEDMEKIWRSAISRPAYMTELGFSVLVFFPFFSRMQLQKAHCRLSLLFYPFPLPMPEDMENTWKSATSQPVYMIEQKYSQLHLIFFTSANAKHPMQSKFT
jgi:hypothetical protein